MKPSALRMVVEAVAALSFVLLPLILVPVVTPVADHSVLQPVLRGIVLIHGLIVCFYFWNFYFALPRLYFAGRKRSYVAITVTILLAIILLLQTNPNYNPFPDPPFRYPNLIFIMSIVVRFMMALFVSFVVATFGRLRRSEAERLRAELSFLKAQVNPHFLFNTLNSIYALVVTKSDSAPAAITKLASIMRYVTDEATLDHVPLEKELSYITAYLDLEKLRLNPKAKLNFEINGAATGKNVPPLLLLPLIENAFKHGVSADQQSTIDIKIEIRERDLSLRITNTRPHEQQTRQGGLGLANLRRRLALLNPAANSLSIEENEQYFSSELKLGVL